MIPIISPILFPLNHHVFCSQAMQLTLPQQKVRFPGGKLIRVGRPSSWAVRFRWILIGMSFAQETLYFAQQKMIKSIYTIRNGGYVVTIIQMICNETYLKLGSRKFGMWWCSDEIFDFGENSFEFFRPHNSFNCSPTKLIDFTVRKAGDSEPIFMMDLPIGNLLDPIGDGDLTSIDDKHSHGAG